MCVCMCGVSGAFILAHLGKFQGRVSENKTEEEVSIQGKTHTNLSASGEHRVVESSRDNRKSVRTENFQRFTSQL